MVAATARPVLLGVDGSPGDAVAIRMSIIEAALRNRPIRVVAGSPPFQSRSGRWPSPHGPQQAQTAARARLRATGRVDDTLAGTVSHAPLSDVLIEESPGAEVVITVAEIAAMVAPYSATPILAANEAPTISGPVLVCVDATAPCASALDYAFDAATARGVPLRPVFVWTALPVAVFSAIEPHDVLAAHAEADRLLAEVLVGWGDKYADVPVQRHEIRAATVEGALLRATASACLAVVGGRSSPSGAGRSVGPVTRAVMTRAQCPVAVVRLEE